MSAAAPQGPAPRRTGLLDWLEQRLPLTEMLSLLTYFGLVSAPLDTAKPAREALRELSRKPEPRLSRGWSVLGPLAIILFGLQAATGMLLAFYYRPTPEAAFESTRMIVRDLPLGTVFHQMHAWGAWALIVVVLLRVARLFWDGGYRAPRELLWWSALALASLATMSEFTGRVLTWDAHAYWSTVRGMEMLYAVPIAGPVLSFLLGGRAEHEYFLIRFYVLHVAVLPVALLAVFYLTTATLRRLGGAPATAGDRPNTVRDHLYGMTTLTVVLFALLATLAVLLPFRFQTAADPYVTPVGVRPPWYQLAPYLLIQHLPLPRALTGLVLLAAVVAVWLMPFWRRDVTPAARRRTRFAGVAAFVLWLALSVVSAIVDGRVKP